MSFPPKGGKRGRPEWTDPALRFKMQVLGAVHSAAWVFAGGETRRAGKPPPVGETTPLVGAYSIVRGGLRCRPGLPSVRRLLQPAGYDRESRMFVVVDHLLDVVVVALVVADTLLVANGGQLRW